MPLSVRMMAPAPRKPMPVTICAAMRAGIAERSRHLDRHEREQRRADGDEDVGAQPGILLPELTLDAERRPEQRRHEQTPDQFEIGYRWHIGCNS